jgi:hypothetical protein
VIGRFRSPGPLRLKRPEAFTARRLGALATLRWRPVRGASSYAVILIGEGGSRSMRIVRGTRARIPLARPRGRATAEVLAISAAGVRGPLSWRALPLR